MFSISFLRNEPFGFHNNRSLYYRLVTHNIQDSSRNCHEYLLIRALNDMNAWQDRKSNPIRQVNIFRSKFQLYLPVGLREATCTCKNKLKNARLLVLLVFLFFLSYCRILHNFISSFSWIDFFCNFGILISFIFSDWFFSSVSVCFDVH